jgi:hypothetical protein
LPPPGFASSTEATTILTQGGGHAGSHGNLGRCPTGRS